MTLEIVHKTVPIKPIKSIILHGSLYEGPNVLFLEIYIDGDKFVMERQSVSPIKYTLNEFDRFIEALQELRNQFVSEDVLDKL